MPDTIHVVCLDAPSPPDYGGAIDMYYKVKALHQIGKKVILHYFNYHPSRHAKEMEEFCAAIHAYKRKKISKSLPLTVPHIIQSRINKDLIARLNADDYPILLEGLHCAGIVPYLEKKERTVIRMHNEEAAYYFHLAKTENSLLKRAYFIRESKLLAQYLTRFDKTIKLACLSETDIDTFRETYWFKQVSFVPCFIPWQQVAAREGTGDYCLYHGNLAVSENNEAATWLIKHVFSKITVPLVIAGKGISKGLLALASGYRHIKLIQDPSIDEVNQLVKNAQINVLPSMNNTGVKLKLLNALLNGRFCITNNNGVKGSRINKGVVVQDEAAGWIHSIETLMQKRFSAEDITDREAILALYNNQENALKLSALWSHYQ